jgi:hypothetical protein
MINSFFSFIYYKFEKFFNIIKMNKCLFIALLSLFVINSTFILSNAVIIDDKSTFDSQNDGIKRYVFSNRLYDYWDSVDFILYICFSFVVLQYNELNLIVLLAIVNIGVEVESIVQ